MTHRCFLFAMALLCPVALSAPGLMAAEPSATADSSPNPLDAFKRDEVDKSVDKAMAFLVSRQNKSEGWINDRNSNHTAMTSLAIMALASVGHQPADPTPEGRAMSRALDYVLRDDRTDQRGYLGGRDGSRMYGHGIATLMLSEMIGMSLDRDQDARVRKRLEQAVQLILDAQRVPKDSNNRGGWRYVPDSRDSDLSVSVWQVMALRSAKGAGIDVPAAAIQDAVGYLKRSYYSPLDSQGRPTKKKSGFAYQPRGGPQYPMCAAGLLSMQVCGEYDSPFVAGAADWLAEYKIDKNSERWFFYGTYYYAQGMYQRGGKYAEMAEKKVRELLLPSQKGDGSWDAHHSEGSAGRVYSTSLAVLCLSVKYHYLPIYQR